MKRTAPSLTATICHWIFCCILTLCGGISSSFAANTLASSAPGIPGSMLREQPPQANLTGTDHLGSASDNPSILHLDFDASLPPAYEELPVPDQRMFRADEVSEILPNYSEMAQIRPADLTADANPMLRALVIRAENEVRSTFAAAANLASAVGFTGGQRPSTAQIRCASDKAFEGSEKKGSEGAAPEAVDATTGGSSGNGGGGRNNGRGERPEGGEHLGRLYPRVVMILDSLTEPVSDSLVQYIETLADNGVRVVFVTSRPEKGPNSAESILASKLRVRTTTPIIIASYNGARIAARSSRAENPQPLVADLPGFPQNTVTIFRKINNILKARMKVRNNVSEFLFPNAENPFIYGAQIPPHINPDAWIKAYNRALKGAGLKYKVEATSGANGPRKFFIQSTSLKLNNQRIFEALYAQYPDLRESLKPNQILILADSRKAASFLKSFPDKGYYIHGINDNDSLEVALGAVLGREALTKVSVNRSQLRAYSSWLDARAKSGFARTGFIQTSKTKSRIYRALGFYRGIIIYDLMGRLYKSISKGQLHEATPEAADRLLTQMWRYPRNNWVRISDEMEGMRQSRIWRALERGYLETARVWLNRYYYRNFKHYPDGVGESVMGTLINLARDPKNSITLEYASPYTGRRYLVHVLPARTNLERDEKGYLLAAHVYRTGKEPFESEFQDSLEANLLARAMLQGYADKRSDGKWYVNSEANPRVKVVFHYNTRDLSRIQTPEEIEVRAADVTALIEKMNADKEFLAYWKTQEKKNNKVTVAPSNSKTKSKKGSRKS